MSKNVRKEIKFFLVKNFLARPIYYILNLYSHTLRFRMEQSESYSNHLQQGGRIIFASWHQRFFGGFYLPYLLNCRIAIMISQSRDGDFISDAVSRIGWHPVRGSSSRGGRKALKELIQMMRANTLGGHIVDGPNGPPCVLKPGLISLAQHSGAAIMPVFVSYERPFVVGSWDRFMIPKPFSRVLVRMGEVKTVPEDLNQAGFDQCRVDLEEAMHAGYAKLDRFWDSSDSKSGFNFLLGLKKKFKNLPARTGKA